MHLVLGVCALWTTLASIIVVEGPRDLNVNNDANSLSLVIGGAGMIIAAGAVTFRRAFSARGAVFEPAQRGAAKRNSVIFQQMFGGGAGSGVIAPQVPQVAPAEEELAPRAAER